MKFIVDAQLPRRLARQLADAGHDAVHCLELPAACSAAFTTLAPNQQQKPLSSNPPQGKLAL
jgi:hypothetical protein